MNAWTSDDDRGTGEAGPADEDTPRRHRDRGAAWLATLLLAALTAVIACRATDTDAITPIPQFLAFWP